MIAAQILLLTMVFIDFILNLVKESRKASDTADLVTGVIAAVLVKILFFGIFYLAGAFSEIF